MRRSAVARTPELSAVERRVVERDAVVDLDERGPREGVGRQVDDELKICKLIIFSGTTWNLSVTQWA